MTEKKPINKRRRVTRQTETRRPRRKLARKVRMTLAAVSGLVLGVALVAAWWNEDAGSPRRDGAVAMAMPAAEQRAERKPVEPAVQAPLRESDVVSPAALDLSKATVEGGRYVLDLPDGKHVTLTLVPELQDRARAVLEKYEVPFGALVAVDPDTGAVLALADFSAEKPSQKGFALKANQPAASVFKIITTAALVEGEGVSPEKTVCYHGGLSGFGAEHLRDDPRRDTRCRTLTQALGHSANVVFGKLADKLLDRGKLTRWAERFGFNAQIPFTFPLQPSHIELPQDRVGFATSAAGFHHTQLSPLHAALVVAAVGNEGRMMEPYLVDKVEQGGVTIYAAKPRELRRVVAKETAAALAHMMEATVKEGTAAKYFRTRDKALEGIRIGGKTGSLSSTDDGVRHHNSWFVALAPVDHPQIALAALVLNSGAWRIKGTHLGRAGLESFFKARGAAEAKATQK